MKRTIRITVMLCMLTALLSGCKSSDYKKAQNHFANGEYTVAMSIFEGLENYEDSREMVMECSYRYALQLMDNKNFLKAKTRFEDLGDYKDSNAKIKGCSYNLAKTALEQGVFDEAEAYLKQADNYEDSKVILANLPGMRIMHYLQNNGELSSVTKVSEETHYVVSLSRLTEDAIKINYVCSGRNSSVTSDIEATMVLHLGQTKMQVKGTYDQTLNFFGKISKTEEAVEGELDILTYEYGDEMIWDKTFFKGTDIYGKPTDPKVCGFFQVASNAPLERAFKSVEAMLFENNVGVTLQELGFASLN